ncbi:MAG TPA: oleate hydratase [Pseudomonadales bacterium]
MVAAEDQIYLVGGGIASLAAAVFLIRDAGRAGSDVHIFEGSHVLGGSLDGAGDAESGYVVRGGRMFEEHFACTFDLLDGIPTLSDPGTSAAEEIRSFTRRIVTSSRCRLVIDGRRVEAPEFGLSPTDRWRLLLLSQLPERLLGRRTISDFFSADFLATNFWTMWCTMFAFQPWHSVVEMRRYMRRFMHLLPGFNRLEGIHRTRLNQYDSVVEPVVRWLREHDVRFHLNAPVTGVCFDEDAERVTRIDWLENGTAQAQAVSPGGKVLITLGSMTEASALGSMTEPPAFNPPVAHGAWALWRQIADRHPDFGRPENFAGEPRKTFWSSFTVTLHNPQFFQFMEAFTGNAAGTGGLVTFKHSGWLLSVVLAHQPHFANQDPDTFVFWGYGLNPDRPGDAVRKPLVSCNGREILTELAHHLQITDRAAALFEDAICIPCAMPYITAQFMPRAAGDRPSVLPRRHGNFAFIGQFCELPLDTVFTVEYSVRSAQEAVYGLCDLSRQPRPLYSGYAKPRVVAAAARTLLRNGRR